ncbi:MAG TPA: hypothetical protein VLH84_01030 [Patescibacteria group bacterium]|nr:hypothetical protein [Patescibacteria group bacterium]
MPKRTGGQNRPSTAGSLHETPYWLLLLGFPFRHPKLTGVLAVAALGGWLGSGHSIDGFSLGSPNNGTPPPTPPAATASQRPGPSPSTAKPNASPTTHPPTAKPVSLLDRELALARGQVVSTRGLHLISKIGAKATEYEDSIVADDGPYTADGAAKACGVWLVNKALRAAHPDESAAIAQYLIDAQQPEVTTSDGTTRTSAGSYGGASTACDDLVATSVHGNPKITITFIGG